MPPRSSVNHLMRLILDQMIRPSPKHQTPREGMLQPTALSLARFIRVPCATPMLRVRDTSNQSRATAGLGSSPLWRSFQSLRRFASANSDTSPQNGIRRHTFVCRCDLIDTPVGFLIAVHICSRIFELSVLIVPQRF